MCTHKQVLLAVAGLGFLALLGACGGGPQSSPEAVARAWMEAVVDGRCDTVAAYMAADHQYEAKVSCGQSAGAQFTEARIDNAVVRPYPADTSRKLIVFVGTFQYGNEYGMRRFGEVQCDVEKLAGKWYVDGCLGW